MKIYPLDLLPVGDHTFYFGVDMSCNAVLDSPLYYDFVQVHVTPATTTIVGTWAGTLQKRGSFTYSEYPTIHFNSDNTWSVVVSGLAVSSAGSLYCNNKSASGRYTFVNNKAVDQGTQFSLQMNPDGKTINSGFWTSLQSGAGSFQSSNSTKFVFEKNNCSEAWM